MTAVFEAFRVSYASALDDHLREPGEASLLEMLLEKARELRQGPLMADDYSLI